MGTHPIFESDFDCLTENESHLGPSHAPLGTPRWRPSQAHLAKVRRQLGAPGQGLSIGPSTERGVYYARHVELLAQERRRRPIRCPCRPSHRPGPLLRLGGSLLLSALPLTRPQRLQAIRLAIW